MSILAAFAVAYLLGSIPFGLLLGFMAGKDVRQYGSRNIGATNVWRVCGWKWGLSAFLLDFLKGLAAVLVVQRWFAGAAAAPWPGIAAAAGAVLGHNFPVWLRFKGGKGVATSGGAVVALMWLPAAIGIVAFGLVLAISRYVSLGSMVASLALVAAALLTLPDPLGVNLPLVLLAAALSVMIFVRHRANISRLLAGVESRLF